jgi:hypothetical protein
VFGPAFVAPDGAMDRDAMRERVFSEPAARLQLEAIVHPRVGQETAQRAAQASGPSAPRQRSIGASTGSRRRSSTVRFGSIGRVSAAARSAGAAASRPAA